MISPNTYTRRGYEMIEMRFIWVIVDNVPLPLFIIYLVFRDRVFAVALEPVLELVLETRLTSHSYNCLCWD